MLIQINAPSAPRIESHCMPVISPSTPDESDLNAISSTALPRGGARRHRELL